MSEPITLYDAAGEPVIVYGKAQAAALIAARKATAEKPVKAEKAAEEAPAAPTGKGKKADK